MKQFLTNQKTKHRLEWVLDALSLGAVLQYAAYRFLQSTMFNFYYSQMYKMVTMGLLLVFGGIRYLYVVVGKWKGKNNEEKKKFALYCIGAWILALPFFYVGWLHDYKFLIFLPICCMCLYDMDAGKVCRWFAFTISVLLAATVLCCLSGTVRNLVHTVSDGRVVCAYGIVNTTDFASYFTFLLLIVWCGVRRYEWYIDALFAIAAIVGSYLIFQITDSRTALYIGVINVAVCLWESVRKFIKQKNGQDIGKKLEWLPVITFPVIGIIVLVLTAAYGSGASWAVQLDNGVLTHRLAATLEPYKTYGIHSFGSLIESMHGKGGTIIPNWSAGYGYIDIAYAMLAIRYGWIVAGIVASFWIWMTIKAVRSGNSRIALTMAIMAIHAFSEARILDVNYNILLVMPFSALSTSAREVRQEKKDWVPFVIGVIVIGLAYLFLPRVLSWLRTLFSYKGWNIGIAAYKSLLICVGTVICICQCGSFINRVITYNSKIAIIGVIVTFAFIAVGVLVTNNAIEGQLVVQAERLDEEENVVKLVQSVATQPVYVAEKEEIYKRRYGGFADHIFSTEEIKKGTIITDPYIEAYRIVEAGALYAQLSENTGIYSYDPEVIKALAREGVEWVPYYNGERTCNLYDTAIFNEIEPGNHLSIKGPQKVITANMETDQFAGRYTVTFSLFKAKGENEQPHTAGMIEVLGEAGESVIAQESLYTSDFDADGDCTHSISYVTEGTPKVSYAIKVEPDSSIILKQLTWRQESQLSSSAGIKVLDDGRIEMISNSGNKFNMVELQLWDTITGRYIKDIDSTNIQGIRKGEYLHAHGSGLFIIRLKANGTRRDEWVQKYVYLEDGDNISFNYDVKEFTQSNVEIKDFDLAVERALSD